MNSRIQRGTTAELVIASEASKREYCVSLPISHNSHYDLILDKGSLLRIQVKRAYEVDNHGSKVWCIENRRISGGKKRSYPDKSYDYLAAVDVDGSNIWFIPFEVASKYKAQLYLGKQKVYLNKWI